MSFSRVFIVACLFISTAIVPSCEIKIEAEEDENIKETLAFIKSFYPYTYYQYYQQRQTLIKQLESNQKEQKIKQEESEEPLIAIGRFEPQKRHIVERTSKNFKCFCHPYEKIALKKDTVAVTFLGLNEAIEYPIKDTFTLLYTPMPLDNKTRIVAKTENSFLKIVSTKTDTDHDLLYVIPQKNLRKMLAIPEKAPSSCDKAQHTGYKTLHCLGCVLYCLGWILCG